MSPGERRLYIDDGPGEARGVVTLDGLPERLLIRRVSDRPEHLLGARLAARVRRVDRTLSTLFLDTGSEPDAVMPLTGAAASLAEGARIEVEVAAPPRAGKGAVVRLVGPAEGDPRVLTPAPDLAAQLRSLAPDAEFVSGQAARDAADIAEDAALALIHALPSGGTIAVEPTRALVAVDVDLGGAAGDARKAAGRANREALAAAARVLRLQGLGGPVVFDLAGKGQDGEALRRAAEAAFAPDQPGVAFGPITRFGLWPLTLPRRGAPIRDRLCGPEGSLTDETLALRLLRQIERAAGPGLRVDARCAPDVAAVAERLAPALAARIGPRFRILGESAALRLAPIVRPWEEGR